MIYDLKEFGKWLNEHELVDFGKNVNSDDYILKVVYSNGNFSLDSIGMTNDIKLDYIKDSCFNENLYFSGEQNIIIPSMSNLIGFSPFFLKLDHNFQQRNGDFNLKKINTFKNKINRSLNANQNKKDFCYVIFNCFNDLENNFIKKCVLNNQQIKNLNILDEKFSTNELSNLITDYYSFLLDASDDIISLVSDFKKSDKYSNKKSNFYITCVFNDERDFLNDFFYLYTNFLKSRSNKFKDYEDGVCSICGNNSITYPPFTYYNIDSSFNLIKNMENSKLKLCKNCSSFIKYAEDKLFRIIKNPSLLLIPKIKYGDYEEFIKIANTDSYSFEKFNRFLRDCNNLNFDLAIINKDAGKNDLITIKRYIENYRAFLIQFDDLYLYDNNRMKYLFFEKLSKKDLDSRINNTFDFENIFKELFYEIDNDGKYCFPNLFHFYEIYTKDLTGSRGIFNNFSSSTISLFSKYSEHIFSFIYELNLNSLTKNIIDELFLHSIMIFQKHSFGDKKFSFDILKRLNYYFMFRKEFLEDTMFSNNDVLKLKKIFDKNNEEMDIYSIKKLIENDPTLKYYLLGQFISYLDIRKGKDNKNNDIFFNFITNINRNNIKKLFVTEILQKNNYYINKVNKKVKVIFNLFEMSLNDLFDEENMEYEDYVILLFTGYYTENILVTSYTFKEE